jgi:GTP pyrophosphokinase
MVGNGTILTLGGDVRRLVERSPLTLKWSKTQIDRLGDRLRTSTTVLTLALQVDDLKLLDEYRRSFGEAYEHVVRTIRERLELEPTGRPAKSTTSILEKLHRESIRLSQIQDIAGCRVIVDDVVEQEKTIASLCAVFPGAPVIDRRVKPSHGYRAVHVIVRIFGKLVEIQVRTYLQHLWAELSEKFSDVFDPSIKYGRGDREIREALQVASEAVAGMEETEQQIPDLHEPIPNKLAEEKIKEFKQFFDSRKRKLAESLNMLIVALEKKRGNKQ